MDETYIRVGGKWRYLWRAVDTNGQMVDFRLTARRDAKAAVIPPTAKGANRPKSQSVQHGPLWSVQPWSGFKSL